MSLSERVKKELKKAGTIRKPLLPGTVLYPLTVELVGSISLVLAAIGCFVILYIAKSPLTASFALVWLFGTMSVSFAVEARVQERNRNR